MPSPATPTEETRVTNERIAETWNEVPGLSKALFFGELQHITASQIRAFARAIESAVLAALPRGEVSEAVRKALAVILDYANGSKWAALSDAVGVAPYAEHLSPRQNTLRVIDAMFALGLSRGGGAGETVAKREREAFVAGVYARMELPYEPRDPANGLRQVAEREAMRRFPDFPAPAPVVRSVRLSDGSVVRMSSRQDLDGEGMVFWRTPGGDQMGPIHWRELADTGADFDALKAFAATVTRRADQ
jgi:hypothetical protein